MIPNPTHYQAVEILYAAIDNILEAYPDVDWIWLWLNEPRSLRHGHGVEKSANLFTTEIPPVQGTTQSSDQSGRFRHKACLNTSRKRTGKAI
jgi:hypothetical protein